MSGKDRVIRIECVCLYRNYMHTPKTLHAVAFSEQLVSVVFKLQKNTLIKVIVSVDIHQSSEPIRRGAEKPGDCRGLIIESPLVQEWTTVVVINLARAPFLYSELQRFPPTPSSSVLSRLNRAYYQNRAQGCVEPK